MPLEVDPAATLHEDDDDVEPLPEGESAAAFTRAGVGARAEARGAPAGETTPSPEEIQPGRVLARRYCLVEPLGEGAHGEVWAATDAVLHKPVALKWMRSRSGSSRPRIRREITTLRMLRIPGVVQLFDEGVEDGRPFLVMERVHGHPFPGQAEPCPGLPLRASWAALASTTITLLEVLSRVHAAGVVHRDLKPDNILVDAAGRPTVLDFGISLWRDPDRRGHARSRAMVGTPRYLAPEQILGGAVDARADLYAVGVMLYEALTGRLPHEAPDLSSLRRARLNERALPVREFVPDLPPIVGQVIDRLLSTRAEGRFRSASKVLAALRGDAHAAALDPCRAAPGAIVRALLSLPPDTLSEDIDALGPLNEAALRPLFAGPDRLFHLREDAARLLWERTEGKPSRIEDEVTLWTRLGLARWDGALLLVDRDALGRLRASLPRAAPASLTPAGPAGRKSEPQPEKLPAARRTGKHGAIAALMRPSEEGRLFHLLAADQTREAACEAVELARRCAREGDLGEATWALSEGLRAVRAQGPQGGDAWVEEGEARILREWTKVALAEGTEHALERARYELSLARAPGPDLERLDALLDSTLKVHRAGALHALEAVNELPPFEDPELERRRHWARVAAAAGLSLLERLEGVLVEVEAWAVRSGDPRSLLSLAEGRARLCYGQGRFKEAAALHAEAAEREPWLAGRIAAMLNAASALLEAFRHREAMERAAEARELSARCRDAYREGRAEWVIRAAMYRLGEAGAPDLELVDAAARVDATELEPLVCLNEAAVAFREGLLPTGAALAGRAAEVWKGLNRLEASLLARSLALACGAPAEAGEVEELSKRAAGCRIPGIGIQALGLLGRAFPEARPPWEEVVPRLAGMVPREHWGERVDVLSVEEAVEWAGGGVG